MMFQKIAVLSTKVSVLVLLVIAGTHTVSAEELTKSIVRIGGATYELGHDKIVSVVKSDGHRVAISEANVVVIIAHKGILYSLGDSGVGNGLLVTRYDGDNKWVPISDPNVSSLRLGDDGEMYSMGSADGVVYLCKYVPDAKGNKWAPLMASNQHAPFRPRQDVRKPSSGTSGRY